MSDRKTLKSNDYSLIETETLERIYQLLKEYESLVDYNFELDTVIPILYDVINHGQQIILGSVDKE